MEKEHLKLIMVKTHEDIADQIDDDTNSELTDVNKQRQLRDYKERMEVLSGEVPRIFLDNKHF